MSEEEKSRTPTPPSVDPALIGKLMGLLGDSGKGSAESATETPATSALPSGLGSVLSNPELMAKLPSMIAMLRPMMEGNEEKKGEDTPVQAPADSVGDGGAIPASVPTSSHPQSSQEHCRKELLLALKPFLSKERCDAVDMILRLSALGALLKKLG